DDIENVMGVDVDASDCEVAFGLLRLFDDIHDSLAFELRHPIARWIGHFLERHPGRFWLLLSGLGGAQESARSIALWGGGAQRPASRGYRRKAEGAQKRLRSRWHLRLPP